MHKPLGRNRKSRFHGPEQVCVMTNGGKMIFGSRKAILGAAATTFLFLAAIASAAAQTAPAKKPAAAPAKPAAAAAAESR